LQAQKTAHFQLREAAVEKVQASNAGKNRGGRKSVTIKLYAQLDGQVCEGCVTDEERDGEY